MHIHGLGIEQALASLKTTTAGLAAPEAARRLLEFGPNHVEEVAREHLLLGFAREFTHFFAIILWIGAALAFLADYFDPGQGMGRLAIAIVGVIIVNGIFSFWQEYKAELAVEALRQLLPQKVQALRSGEIVELLAGLAVLARQNFVLGLPVFDLGCRLGGWLGLGGGVLGHPPAVGREAGRGRHAVNALRDGPHVFLNVKNQAVGPGQPE